VKPLSDAEIQRLAREEPERLIAIIGDPSTDTVTLTFAAGARWDAARVAASADPSAHARRAGRA
jgi:hypothetical protein